MIAVILAGGSGTRFWPLSRRSRPKQLIELFGAKTMLEHTLDRLEGLMADDRILIVCDADLAAKTQAVVASLEAANFVIEPMPRNTAPAIALAALRVDADFGEEVMVVLPSDHYVRDVDGFRACLEAAAEAATPGRIVTLGITPTRPETGYGYIEFDPDERVTESAMRVEKFVEKPDAPTALEYLESGDYLWNAGIFLFQPKTLLAELARQQPEIHAGIQHLGGMFGEPDFDAHLRAAFEEMPSISIDYAVMEGATDVAVVPADVGWSDVGHWAAIDAVIAPDDDGNLTRGDSVLVDVHDSVVFDDTEGVTGVVGMDGIVVVHTDDAVLVIPRERAQDVRQIVDELKRRGLDFT